MSTTPSPLEQLEQQSQTPQQQPQPATTLSPLEQLEQQSAPAPKQSPEDEASNTRQMLVSGLTGMPTPNMNAEDRAQFEKGKAAGAITVPLVAGATTGATAAAEAFPAVLPHTIDGVKAIGAWATKNPIQAYMIYNLLRDLVPGAKKAIGLIKGAPTGEP